MKLLPLSLRCFSYNDTHCDLCDKCAVHNHALGMSTSINRTQEQSSQPSRRKYDFGTWRHLVVANVHRVKDNVMDKRPHTQTHQSFATIKNPFYCRRIPKQEKMEIKCQPPRVYRFAIPLTACCQRHFRPGVTV